MTSRPLRERLLSLLGSYEYRPMDKVELSKALRWPSEQRAELRNMLREMESTGEVARIRKDRYVLPETADLITGKLQVHPSGNAHLVSEGTGKRDLFISMGNMGTGMHGDKVVARLMHEGRQQRKDAKPEARVIRILERANENIVGTLQVSKKNFFYVVPDDPRLQHDVYVRFPASLGGTEAPVAVDRGDKRGGWKPLLRSGLAEATDARDRGDRGGGWKPPLRSGGTEAPVAHDRGEGGRGWKPLLRSGGTQAPVAPDRGRQAQEERASGGEGSLGPRVGDKVVVRMDAWESRHVNPEGEIIEVLGPANAPGVDMLSIVRKHGFPLEFPEAALREADRISETIEPEEIGRREDLRQRFVVTIDPDDAKDFDDAIDVERTPKGWRLGVHIADVSHYVQPGNALDKEAKKRGNSTYLADRVIPMLPERLSNGICSLKPGVNRLTVSAFIEFDERGKIRQTRFARTVIRSAARLTYRQALAILEKRPAPPTPNYERGGKVQLSAKPVPLEVTPQLREAVFVAWELASLLRRNRFAAGSLDLDFPEVKVWLNDEGRAERLERVENDISHQLIEECMLAANETVGRALKERQTPAIYRIHEDPDPDRLLDFRELVKSYGFRTGDLTQRAELQKLLASTRGKPEEYAVKLALLKSLKRARYSTDPSGHYGLAKVNYTHFTSPIRRYADLLVHRAILREKAVPIKALGEIADQISGTERASADAERDSTLLKKMEFFQRQLTLRRPDAFRAIVVDVRSYGLVIELPDCLVTGLIHVSALPGDFYQFDAVRLSFTGRKTRKHYQIGAEIQVIVCRVDAPKRQIDFTPAD